VPDHQTAAGGSGRFAALVKSLGGELSIMPNGTPGGKFSLTFSGPAGSLEKLDALLAEGGASSGCVLPPLDNKFEKIVSKGKEFMAAMSGGDMIRAQEILLALADQQQQPGLYKEIGGLARGLHDSIRSFMNTMDPSLKEIVEDKIPDSGNRLEHMLQLTEKAALTTLDHVEAMQDRLGDEHASVAGIRELLAGLKPIGDNAVKKLAEGESLLDALDRIVAQHRVNLDTILTAQDYQDLSGQIIQKITALLKDLELRLVNMIRTFGVKVETGKITGGDGLYGPAHQAREDTVHSQDEVDSLLAEFGF
ncbi:MAG: protein phosphatase CheZ, partial [Syntrophobacteraceae bacterium]